MDGRAQDGGMFCAVAASMVGRPGKYNADLFPQDESADRWGGDF